MNRKNSQPARNSPSSDYSLDASHRKPQEALSAITKCHAKSTDNSQQNITAMIALPYAYQCLTCFCKGVRQYFCFSFSKFSIAPQPHFILLQFQMAQIGSPENVYLYILKFPLLYCYHPLFSKCCH